MRLISVAWCETSSRMACSAAWKAVSESRRDCRRSANMAAMAVKSEESVVVGGDERGGGAEGSEMGAKQVVDGAGGYDE